MRWKEITDVILLYEVKNPLFIDVIDVEWKDAASQLFELLSSFVCCHTRRRWVVNH